MKKKANKKISPSKRGKDYFSDISNRLEDSAIKLYGFPECPYFHKADTWLGVEERLGYLRLCAKDCAFDRDSLKKENNYSINNICDLRKEIKSLKKQKSELEEVVVDLEEELNELGIDLDEEDEEDKKD